MIQPASAPFHQWRRIATRTDPLPRLKNMARVVDCSADPDKPGTWRYDGGVGCTLDKVAVSQDGRQLVGANPDGSLYHRLFTEDASSD